MATDPHREKGPYGPFLWSQPPFPSSEAALICKMLLNLPDHFCLGGHSPAVPPSPPPPTARPAMVQVTTQLHEKHAHAYLVICSVCFRVSQHMHVRTSNEASHVSVLRKPRGR